MTDENTNRVVGFKNADGRGFHYTPTLAKQAGKFKLVPVHDKAELDKLLAASTKSRREARRATTKKKG